MITHEHTTIDNPYVAHELTTISICGERLRIIEMRISAKLGEEGMRECSATAVEGNPVAMLVEGKQYRNIGLIPRIYLDKRQRNMLLPGL